jgi:exonuclease III
VWIATYNVNGINGRLANLLGWLEKAAPKHRLRAGAEGA